MQFRTRASTVRTLAHDWTGRARARRLTLLLLWSASIAGCARNPEPGEERTVIYRAESEITIRVVNHSQLDANLFLVHDGARDRLGLVSAVSTSSFTVRTRILGAGGEFSLLADPIGQTRATQTQVLRTSEGTTFTWTLETDFSRGAILVQ